MAEEDGKILKQEEDFTPDVDKALPEATSLSEVPLVINESCYTGLTRM